jgi:hypothetical protein
MMKLDNLEISRIIAYFSICSFSLFALYPLGTLFANKPPERLFFCSADQSVSYNYRIIWSDVFSLPADGDDVYTQRRKSDEAFKAALVSKGYPIVGSRCWSNEVTKDLESKRKLEIEDYSTRYTASEFKGWHPSKPGSGSIVSVGTIAASKAPPVTASGSKESIIVRDVGQPATAKPATEPAPKPVAAAKPAPKPAAEPAPKKPTKPCGRKGQRKCDRPSAMLPNALPRLG